MPKVPTSDDRGDQIQIAFAMPKPVEFFELRNTHPKLVELQEPYFILQFEADSGATLELKLQRQALEYLADEIKDVRRKPG
jgi:hypothetical protein